MYRSVVNRGDFMIGMEQTVQLAQTLQLSPTLLQSMKILQMNTEELSDYLNTVAEENPVLEREEVFGNAVSWEDLTEKIQWLHDVPGPHGEAGEDSSWEHGAVPSAADSLTVFLNDQLSRLKLSPQMLALTKFLAEMLDEHGYLNEEDLSDLAQKGVPKHMLKEAVSILQSLEPAGIAARNLSECFVLQLSRLPGDHTLTFAVVENCLELLARQNYERIAKKLGITVSQVQEAEAEIRTLNPHPMGEFAEPMPTVYIRPDAWIGESEGKIEVFLNRFDLPQFRLSGEYLNMLTQHPDKDVEQYLRQKIQQARWLLQCVERRHTTLESCLFAIATWQSAYFSDQGGVLLPMAQHDIAEELRVNPSTVSRAIRNKYLQCRQGLFPLSFFFSRRVGQGQDTVSPMLIKQNLAQLIRQEDTGKPLSDQQLTVLLQQNGIQVSRRAVAKYRDELGFPSSYRRKTGEHSF